MNKAAFRLGRRYSKRGAKAQLARDVGLDEGYLNKILSAERVPGTDVRGRFWRIKRVPMHWWDEPPNPEQRTKNEKPAGKAA